MKKEIQHKIDQIMQIAETSVKVGDFKQDQDESTPRVNNDSLSISIRNEVEASLFLAELDAAIKVGQGK